MFMTQQRITFEWRIGEAEYELWSDSQLGTDAWPGDALLSQREQRLVNNILRFAALFTVVVLAAAGLSVSPRQLEWAQAEAGIRRNLDRENRAWYNLDRDMYLGTIDPYIDNDWASVWRRHWRGDPGNRLEYGSELGSVEPLGDGLMRVTVESSYPATEWSDVEDVYDVRFYRETEFGWVRTVPSPYSDYWGETHTLDVDGLRFVYPARDEEAVRAAAPQVATAVQEVYRLLDIAPPPGYETFVVELRPERMSRWSWDGNHIRVSSPTFGTVPQGLTRGEDLAESVVSRLTYRIFAEATEPGGRFLFRWTVMNWGLRRWMNNHLLEQPSPWHAQSREIFRQESMGRLPISPYAISDNEQVGRPERNYVIWRFLAAETLIEYGVETYGEGTLPALFRGFSNFSSWDELTNTVYGVDLATFTAGWNQYLIEQYDMAGDAAPGAVSDSVTHPEAGPALE